MPPTPNETLNHVFAALSQLRVLSIGSNPLGACGVEQLFLILQDLGVTTLNIPRVISGKLAGDRKFSAMLKGEVCIDYFSKVKDGCSNVCVTLCSPCNAYLSHVSVSGWWAVFGVS